MAAKKTASAAAPSRDAIEKRAREIYEDRVRKNETGDALSDWLKAEAELRKKG